MDPILAGIELGGGIAASAANVHIANKQMRFQERMSNTAHQREVKDLIAAGLHPSLSSRFGGASTPGGSGIGLSNPMDGLVSSAVQSKQWELNKATTEAQIDNLAAQTNKHMQEGWAADALAAKLFEERNRISLANSRAQFEKDKLWPLEKRILESNASNAESSVHEQKANAELWKEIGGFGKAGKMLMPLLMLLIKGRLGGTKYVPVPSYEYKGY